MLEVRIQKQLGAFSLNVSFTTEGTLGILGASGSGKSVTLQCIAGTMKPDRGRIVLNGRVLFDSDAHICLSPQNRNIGYLFQQYALFPNMTVAQNIHTGIRSGTRAEKREIVLQALRTFRLEDVQKQDPKTLSGGQQQRTALARMLVGNPDLLLLDEPFSALDRHLGGTLALELHRVLADYNGDVLFVSHDRDEVRSFCPVVCVLSNGSSEPPVPMDSLLSAPKTAAAARLAGYRNLFPADVLGAMGVAVRSSGWVCVPETAVLPCAPTDPGAICCKVLWSRFDGGSPVHELQPQSAPADLILCMRGTDNCTMSDDSTIWVRIDENALFFL